MNDTYYLFNAKTAQIAPKRQESASSGRVNSDNTASGVLTSASEYDAVLNMDEETFEELTQLYYENDEYLRYLWRNYEK